MQKIISIEEMVINILTEISGMIKEGQEHKVRQKIEINLLPYKIVVSCA